MNTNGGTNTGASGAANGSENAAAPAGQPGSLRRRVLSLGTANAIDYGLQFLLPVLLTRCLPPEVYGEYRMAWLVIMTVMALAPLQMPAVLYYFLPRADEATKRLHVHQTLLYLLGAGLLGAAAASSLNPLLPESVRPLWRFDPLLPLLVLLYTVSLLLDSLPTIEERIGWQARATVSFSLLRTLTLGSVACATGDLQVLLATLAGLLGVKTALLLAYIGRYHGLRRGWLDRHCFQRQLRHAAPLGAAAALYSLRGQADQWVAALLFSLAQFAAFSVATVLGPLVNLFRQSINQVYLPSMSRLQAANDLRGMAALNSRANSAVALLVFPLLAVAFVHAEELLALVYTPAYQAGAPVMRIHILGLVILCLELSSLMLLQGEGAYVLRLNIALIAASLGASLLGAHLFGLAGAALGSTTALLADRWLTLMRIARVTGISLRELQDWARLARLGGCAVLAALLGWQLGARIAGDGGGMLRLAAGGGILLATYAGLVALVDRRRLATTIPAPVPAPVAAPVVTAGIVPGIGGKP